MGSAETSPSLSDKYSVYIIQPTLPKHVHSSIRRSQKISEWKELKFCMVCDTDYVQMYTLKAQLTANTDTLFMRDRDKLFALQNPELWIEFSWNFHF